jgi:hypothetical protein
MLDDFSGVNHEDKYESTQVEQKKKKFIQMTIFQAEEKTKRDEQNRIKEEAEVEADRIRKEKLGDKYKRKKLTKKREDRMDVYENCYESRKKYNDKRERIENASKLSPEEKKKELIKINLDEKEGVKVIKVDKYGDYDFDEDGKAVWHRMGSVLKNIKGKVGASLWPLLPGIESSIKNSEATNIFERNAEKAFIDLFNHSAHQYEKYNDIGKSVNPYDPQGRSNTEIYYEIKEGGVPEDIQKIVDFTKAAKGTEDDKIYIKNLRDIFKLKKALRSARGPQGLLDKAKAEKENHMVNLLNYNALGRINKIRFEKNPNIQNKLLKNIPPDRLEEFKDNVVNSGWSGKTELSNEYYLWLGLKGPVKSKITYDNKIDKHQKAVDAAIGKISDKERKNARLRQKTTASSKSYLRMAHAECEKALSKIYKLYKIKKFSYRFSSVDVASIDDIILGIEKDFENLLDSLLE